MNVVYSDYRQQSKIVTHLFLIEDDNSTGKIRTSSNTSPGLELNLKRVGSDPVV